MANQGQARIVLTAQDETRAAFASVGKKFTDLKSQADGVKATYAKVAGAVTGAIAAIGAVNIVNNLDQLNDLSKKAGIAATTLGGIGFAAQQAGGDIVSTSAGIGKLNKTLAEAAAGGKDAAEPFKLLGVEVLDAAGKTRGADQILIDLATRFADLEDGPEKTALALRIFGKAGADMIPLLDEGGKSLQKNIEYFEKYSKVTPEGVAAADEFNDTLTKLRLVSTAVATEAVTTFLPAFQAVVEQLIEVKEKGAENSPVLEALKVIFQTLAIVGANVAFVFGGVGREIGAIAAQIVALATLDLQGFHAISDAVKADGERARAELDAFEKKVMGTGAAIVAPDYSHEGRGQARAKGAAPRLAAAGAGDQAAAILKKQLDQQLKVIEQFEADQKLAIDFGNALAKSSYEDGFLTLEELFRRDQAARDGNLRATTDALDKEIAALQAYKANPITKPEQRVEAETKIKEAVAKRALTVTKAAQDSILAFQDEARALQQLKDRYADVQASILALQGKTLEASGARIEVQVREALKVINQVGGDPAQAEQLRKLLGDTEKLTDVKRRYALVTEAARDAEESLQLAAVEGGRSEQDTLRGIGVIRQQSLGQLKELADAAAKVAAEIGSPEAIAASRQLSLAFQRATAEADPLLQKMRDIGAASAEAITSPLEDAIQQWKGFKNLLGSIEQQLLQVAIRSQFIKPLNDYLTNAIGGNGQASGGGGLFGGALKFLGVGGGSSSGGGGFGTGAGFGNLDFGGFFADGGYLQPGQWGIAGENGPERIYGGASGMTVHANDGGARPIVINQSFAPGTDSKTTGQAAAQVAQALARHNRRFN